MTFAGGPLADDVEGTFSVTMTLPPTPDTTIYFPFVQRCEVGEIRWIQIPTEPGDELDEPAPAMIAHRARRHRPPTTAPVTEPTEPETTAPATTDAATTDHRGSGDNRGEAETTRGARPTSEPVSTGVDEAGDPRTGTIMFIVSVAAVLGIGAFVVYRSRQARAAAPRRPA